MESKIITPVTKEALSKAFEVFDAIIKGNETGAIANTPGAAAATDEKVTEDKGSDDIIKANETAAILFKAGMTKEVIVDTLVKGGFNAAISAISAEALFTDTTDAVLKSDQVTEIAKSEFNKSITPVTETLGKMQDTLLKGFQSMGVMVQDLTSKNDELIKSNEALALRIEKLESTPAGGRKSVAGVGAIDKFQKANGEGGDLNKADAANTFNVANKSDLRSLVNRIKAEDDNIISKGGKSDPVLTRAIEHIEIANVVPENAYQKLASLGIKLVAPEKVAA